jgi:hypothetical protein
MSSACRWEPTVVFYTDAFIHTASYMYTELFALECHPLSPVYHPIATSVHLVGALRLLLLGIDVRKEVPRSD